MSKEQIEEAIRSAIEKKTAAVASLFAPPVNSRAYGCSIDGCVRPAYAKKMCNAHYIRSTKGMDMTAPVKARKRGDLCSECGKKCNTKGGWGMCVAHYKVARAKAIKSAIVEAMGGKCERCDGSFPLPVFDFHHVGEKEDSPSALIQSASLDRIADEVSKCILLCANCHRIEHANERV